MPEITQSTRLERVEHILGSGTGTLDFAVEGEQGYYTWEGGEESEWTVDDVCRVENAEEDRFVLYPEESHFVCEVEITESSVSVECWCE